MEKEKVSERKPTQINGGRGTDQTGAGSSTVEQNDFQRNKSQKRLTVNRMEYGTVLRRRKEKWGGKLEKTEGKTRDLIILLPCFLKKMQKTEIFLKG